LLLIALAAHADNNGFRYDHWQDTNGWHGQTRTQSTTTDLGRLWAEGEQRHCPRYYVGDRAYTTCN
jgi:hypothetical protein